MPPPRAGAVSAARYAAFLRGVSPMNASMPDLRRALEAAGFEDVATLLSSGNVLFGARPAEPAALERRLERALQAGLGRTFPAHVRPLAGLRALVDADPWKDLPEPAGGKRVVTFLRRPPAPLPRLPVEEDGARILACRGAEAFTSYVRAPAGPVFMSLIERTFGKDVTTRTWDTVRKVAADRLPDEARPAPRRGRRAR